MKVGKELGVQGDALWFTRGVEMLTENEEEDGERNRQK